jgi:hypothetical protein
MKRASLAAVPVTKKTETRDLTDRLLSEKPAPAPTAARAAAARPRAKAPAPKPARPAALSPARPTSSTGALEKALEKSRAAVDALRDAAAEAPARYDVAVRYRLDALAHHLNQIAEFMNVIRRR